MSREWRRFFIGQAIAISIIIIVLQFLARDDHPPLPDTPPRHQVQNGG